MQFENNVVALLLPIWLVVVKEYLPYRIKKYGALREDGTYNEEKLTDIKKELIVAFIRFPSDLMIISAGYIVARIFASSEAIIHASSDTIVELTKQLNTNHVLFWVTLLLFLPLCVLITRTCEALVYPRRKEMSKTTKAIVLTVILYIITIAIAKYIPSNTNIGKLSNIVVEFLLLPFTLEFDCLFIADIFITPLHLINW